MSIGTSTRQSSKFRAIPNDSQIQFSSRLLLQQASLTQESSGAISRTFGRMVYKGNDTSYLLQLKSVGRKIHDLTSCESIFTLLISSVLLNFPWVSKTETLLPALSTLEPSNTFHQVQLRPISVKQMQIRKKLPEGEKKILTASLNETIMRSRGAPRSSSTRSPFEGIPCAP